MPPERWPERDEEGKGMSFVRVKLSGMDAGWEDYPIVVDLRIDDESGSADNRRGFVFGAMGTQKGDDFWPFRLDQATGRIDFGSGSERNAWTNLLDKAIRRGEYCTYQDTPGDAETTTYRIDEIVPLE